MTDSDATGAGTNTGSGSGSGTNTDSGIGGPAFPWHWSVVPWFDGGPAGAQRLDADLAADDLGRFLAALHTPAPVDAPANPGRGGPLSSRHRMTVERIQSVTNGQQQEELLATWSTAVGQPVHGGPPMWLHGDLHSYNVLADHGRISAVIDFGDITSGDPATDLALGFSLFEGSARERFRVAADTATRPIDDAMWLRAKGWAITVGTAVLANSADNPTMAALGRRMIAG